MVDISLVYVRGCPVELTRWDQAEMDNILKRVFFNESTWPSIKISLKFVSKGPISNIPALVQIMAWRRSSDKPLSEPMMVCFWPIYKSLGLNELTNEKKLSFLA